MIRIETLSELRRAWRAVLANFSRDLRLSGRLAADPLAAMRDMGYEVSGEAALALRKCVP